MAAVTGCVCFDFDGTLVDSVDAALNAFAVVGPAFGCQPLSRAQFRQLRGLHLRDVLRTLRVPFYRVPQLARRMRTAMRAELMETPPVPGISNLLKGLSGSGQRLGVLSSNAGSSVEDYLARHDLAYFDFVIGGTGLFSKASALRGLIRREGIQPSDLLYVGDELRDVEAAQRVGARCAAVGWGYTALDSLAAARPDYLAGHPDELLAQLALTEGLFPHALAESTMNKI